MRIKSTLPQCNTHPLNDLSRAQSIRLFHCSRLSTSILTLSIKAGPRLRSMFKSRFCCRGLSGASPSSAKQSQQSAQPTSIFYQTLYRHYTRGCTLLKAWILGVQWTGCEILQCCADIRQQHGYIVAQVEVFTMKYLTFYAVKPYILSPKCSEKMQITCHN